MTRDEWLRRTSAQVQNLRERIATAEDECLLADEEKELQGLERKMELLTGGSSRRGRRTSV